MIQPPINTVFFNLEKAIKQYRKFAQYKINKTGHNITVDQWLILKTIADNEGVSQKEIAKLLFKEIASVTRMIELLVKKEYLERSIHEKDRRRFRLKVTEKSLTVINDLSSVVKDYRETALGALSKKDIQLLNESLERIIGNCVLG